jgi:uncharacterized membrane protein
VIVERERTDEYEPAYGIRKLVDVAERSMYSSPPTMSVQSLNASHDALRRAAASEFPSGVHRDSAGRPRLIERLLTGEG